MSWKSSAEPLARREVEIRLQRYKEFLDYARKKQNYSTAYGLLTKFIVYRGIKGAKNFEITKI